MKYFVAAIAVLVYLFACNWVFNHINPWVAVAMLLVGLSIIINYITKLLKNTK